MMIRKATIEDLGEIFGLVVSLEREVPFVTPDHDYFIRNWTSLLESGGGVIFVKYGQKIIGFFAGIFTNEMNSGAALAIESLWYVEPEFRRNGIGKELLKNFEEWAKLKGVRFVVTAKPYRKLKVNQYLSLETFLIKEI